MISINSSSNFLSTLKNNFRRHIAIFSVFQVFAIIVSIFLVSLEANSAGVYYSEAYPYDVTNSFPYESFTVLVVLFSLEALILVATMFSGIYSKRASDYYFSLPVKRGVWFNANYLFGVINFAVSYAIFYIISLITFNSGIFRAFRFMKLNAGVFLKYILMSFAAVIVLYTVFVMCAVVAGRMWQYILLCFVSSVMFYIGIAGFIWYLNTIYGSWVNLSEAYTVSALNLAFSDVTELPLWKFQISAAVQFVIFYVAGYFSFRKRKAEVAENRLAGKVLPIALTVICFLAEVFVCLGLGNEISLLNRIIAAVIHVVVTAVILSAIFFRRAMSKPVLASVVGTVVITALCVLTVQLVPEKTYVYTMPAKDEIKSVSICNYGSGGSSSIIDILYGSSYLEKTDVYYYGEGYSFVFSTDEAKEKVLQLHEKLLSDETRDNVYSDDYYRKGNTSLSMEYKLENGKTFKRFYDVSTKDIIDAYADLLKTDEGMNQLHIFDFKAEDILFVTADAVASDEDYTETEDWDNIEENTYENTVFIDDINVNKLYECIKMDLKNADAYRFILDTGVYINTGWNSDIDYACFDESDDWIDNSEYSESDLELGFYKFCATINSNNKEKLEKLSPKEILEASHKHDLQNDYNTQWIEDFYIFINTDAYKNTVSYLEELGYKF